VPHAAVEWVGQARRAGGVAQRFDPERPAGGAALLAALVVAGRARQVVGRAGVEHGQQMLAQVERHGAQLGPAHIDAHGLAALAAQRGERVEQPGLPAGPVVLHARAQARERDSLRRARPRDLAEREAQRHAKRGRRGQARAERDVAGDRQAAGA
jgi:hypothetical protein